MTPAQRLRQLANLLNASTPLGLLLARLAGTTTLKGPRGLIIATGYDRKLPIAGAFAVGNVIIYRTGPEAALANSVLLGHEERHSTQYACFGLPFPLNVTRGLKPADTRTTASLALVGGGTASDGCLCRTRLVSNCMDTLTRSLTSIRT
jgi:hypothetical protein